MAESGGKKPLGKQNPEITPETTSTSRGKVLTSLGVGVVAIALGFLGLTLYQRYVDKLHLASASQSLSAGMKPGDTKNILPKLSPKMAQNPITESKPDNKTAVRPAPAKPETSIASVATIQAHPKAPASNSVPFKVEALETETPKVAVKPAASQTPKPRFDIVRVEPDGTAVIAGRATPGAEVEVMSGKKSIGKMKSNTRGEWVLVLKKPLKPGAHDLSIVSNQPNSKIKQHSQQKVAVAVPVRRDEKPLVVLSRKNKPSQVLQLPEQPKQRAVPKGKLALKIVDYDNTGRIVFTGSATPGATARIYVDNRFLRDAAVDSVGAWQLRATAKIPPGNHRLRIDELDKIGKVTARIQLPFTRAQPVDVAAINKLRNALKAGTVKVKPAPASLTMKVVSRPALAASPQTQMVEKPSTPTTRMTVTVTKEIIKTGSIKPVGSTQPAKTPEVSAPSTMSKQAKNDPAYRSATQQIAAVRDPAMRGGLVKEPAAPVNAQPVLSNGIVIQPGNNLWNISRVVYGEGAQYTVIYQANTDQIRDPDLIFPGQIFKTPGATPPRVIPPDRREPIAK